MTIIEAEKQYELEVEEWKARCEQFKRKASVIGRFIGIILIIIGVVLFIVGATKSPIVYEASGFVDNNNTLEYVLGALCSVWGVVAIFIGFQIKRTARVNYLQANKNLYMNYVRCTDMEEQDREYYRQKLKEIRMAELRKSISNAGAAVLFSQLIK